MSEQPRNVIFLIADSLRFDSVYSSGIGMPYVQSKAISFTEARSAGCWTLPATASLFTGLLPHEHGATSQTRTIRKDIPNLAEQMKKAGYNTYQVTANVVTTDIFGLNRGFDEVRRIWKMVDPKFGKLQEFFVMISKPRLRKKLFSKDPLVKITSADVEAMKTWLQHTYLDVFEQARQIIRENEAKGEKSFIFLNLMETHFPYHIAPTFELSTHGLWQKFQELKSLFHMLNQTFLRTDRQHIKAQMLERLRQRQQTAWQSIAPQVNAFCKEMHENTGNLVVFGADHGENFGETGWTYHFSNVTDAGTKVPLFWLPHNGDAGRVENTPISSRHIYNSFLRAIGKEAEVNGPCILKEAAHSQPIMQSFWYNNQGKTLDKFKYNQVCFLLDENRYLLRNNEWYQASNNLYDEPIFSLMSKGVNPLYDLGLDNQFKKEFLKTATDFQLFSDKIPFKVKEE